MGADRAGQVQRRQFDHHSSDHPLAYPSRKFWRELVDVLAAKLRFERLTTDEIAKLNGTTPNNLALSDI